MLYTGIDLAERHSAAVTLDHHGEVIHETCLDAGTQEKPANPWKNIAKVREWWVHDIFKIPENHPVTYGYFVIETPYFHARNAENALMVQGGLMNQMLGDGIEPCHRITPLTWQQHFGYSKKDHGDPKVWAEEYARLYLNYTPGMTWPEGTRMVKKMREDLIDARLLAQWLYEQIHG